MGKMTAETRTRIAAWRSLSDAEKTRRRRALVVDQVIASMAMEGEPVSPAWIESARRRSRPTSSVTADAD
uniref:VbhA-like antitoxin n=1 Tax=Mycobacterium phage LilBib TaxID=3136622 RepID=A0AAU8GMA6_9VIRU